MRWDFRTCTERRGFRSKWNLNTDCQHVSSPILLRDGFFFRRMLWALHLSLVMCFLLKDEWIRIITTPFHEVSHLLYIMH